MNEQLLITDPLKLTLHEWVDLQTLGRFGQTNHEYNKCFHQMVLCTPSSLPRCFLALKDDFDQATPVVQFYARECISNMHDNRVRILFKHIFDYHEEERKKGYISNFGNIYTALTDYIHFYEHPIAPWNFFRQHTANRDNLLKLRKFISKNNLVAAKTLLLCEDFLYDILWDNNASECRKKSQYCQCYGNHKNLLEVLFKNGDKNIILQAVEKGCKNVSWNAVMSYAIGYAKKYNRENMVIALLQKNYAKSLASRWDIYLDALTENVVVKEVIDLFFSDDIQAKRVFDSSCKLSLLDYAVHRNKVNAVSYLLEKGADPNEIDSVGSPLLHRAYNSDEITELFIKHGAYVDIANENGTTALLALPQRYAWNHKKEQVLRMLLRYNANVNKKDKDGKTALHYFADLEENYNGSNCDRAFQMIPLLIQHGARVDIKDNDGKIPLDHARARKNKLVIHMLSIKNNLPSNSSIFSNTKVIIMCVGLGGLGLYLLFRSHFGFTSSPALFILQHFNDVLTKITRR